LVLLGLVYDGGSAVDARVEAHRAAEQAARAAADQMQGVRDENEAINLSAARTRANQILTQSGWSGTVTVKGLDVTVRVTGKSENTFLGVIGIKSFPVDVMGTATSISGPN
jgi:Flp pilus assembly protein TadG